MAENKCFTKKILTLLLVIFGCGNMKAQVEFAPIGAEWHYDYNNAETLGYVLIESVSDTIIDGINCRKLVKSYNVYDQTSDTLKRQVVGHEYMTQINDSVMIYRYGKLMKLYDLNAKIGERLTFPGSESEPFEDTGRMYGYSEVLGKGFMEIGGENLKYIDISKPEGFTHECVENPWQFSCYVEYENYGKRHYTVVRICERIGNVSGYLLPEPCYMSDVTVKNEGGALRCYSDSEMSVSFPGNDCDYVECEIDTTRLYQSYFGKDSTTINSFEEIDDGIEIDKLTIRSGDTVRINDYLYYKITDPYGYNYDEYYREETRTGRLYYMSDRIGKEVLVCDMSLKVGDVFRFYVDEKWWFYDEVHDRVEARVRSVIMEGNRKVIEFDHPSFELCGIHYPNSITFMEGVFPIWCPGYNTLLCHHKDGEQVYHNPYVIDVDDCYLEDDSFIDENKNEGIRILPTFFSSGETISIKSDSDIKDIKMIDMLGRDVKVSINPTDDFSCEMSLNQKCNSGIYLIIVETEKCVRYEKVVLH